MHSAITYNIKPGHEDEIAAIFSPQSFVRANTSVLRDENGTEVGRIHGTGLFIRDGFMARVIHHEGDIRAVGRHMASQQGVKAAERQLEPYLEVPRDTATPEKFRRYFQTSLMDRLQDRSLSERPGEIAAFRHQIKPGKAEEIAEVFQQLPKAEDPALRDRTGDVTGAILGVALFLHGDSIVRAVRYQGSFEDLGRFMADWPQRPILEQKLAPYLDEEPARDRDEFLANFQANALRRISSLTTHDHVAV
jgi:hypothetical protein